MRVLVLGGTGVFGSRFCRLLAGTPGVALTVAARDHAAVASFAREIGADGRAFDWRTALDHVLRHGGFDVLVHAAGPFQGQDYGVAELCVRYGIHYIDLADDAAFVQGIDRLDACAKEAGVLICSGASTVPAITGAVVEQAVRKAPVERVAFGIMPGNDAPRGPAVVRAIVGSVGRPITGQPGRHVWGGLRRMALPGVGKRWVAACDLPEPALFKHRFGIRDTFAGAGLELSMFHLGLWIVAWLVRGGLVATLAPAAPLLAAVADRLRFLGTDRGGLRVELLAGDRLRVWHLVVEGGDGPFIPVIPAVALVRKLAAGMITPGAMPCLGLLTLAEIEAEWRRAGLRVACGWKGEANLVPSLYRRVLGGSYEGQARAGQILHDAGASHWQGRCAVTGARTAAGRVAAWLFGFPRESAETPIDVQFEPSGSGELWTRTIGGRVMRSRQFIGVRKPPGWLVERFGLFEFDLEVQTAEQRLALGLRGMRIGRVPLPRMLWPRVDAVETEEEGRFCFDVQIAAPLIGRLVRYRGWLIRR
ncbi:MAG: DUF4166 domain-containing protein [Pseudomonadota bacterium]